MESIKFSGIIKEPQIEDDKIVATWKQPEIAGKIILNDTFFNWDLIKELNKISIKDKNRDRYRGMFKNEN